jgi:hypothetical protein
MQVPAAPDGARIAGSDKDKHGCIGSAGYPFLLCLDFWYASIDFHEVTVKSLVNRVLVSATIITT